MIGQRQPGNSSHHQKTRGCEAVGRAVLLDSLTLLFSVWALFSNKVSFFVSMCVPSDNSFLSVRQEPTLGLWKGSPFPQQYEIYLVFASCFGTEILKPLYFSEPWECLLPFINKRCELLLIALEFLLKRTLGGGHRLPLMELVTRGANGVCIVGKGGR